MKNPYEILGVSHNATEEQIKEAQIVENINPSENTIATETQAADKPKMSKKKLAIIAAAAP